MGNIILKPVTIRIKNVTGSESNEWLLLDLSRAGIKRGVEVRGQYNPISGSVQFSNGTADCVAWVGETCEIIDTASD